MKARSTELGPEAEDAAEPLAGYLERAWQERRAGAIAGRGFHYQDAVGAWLALQQHQGKLNFDHLVPEGLEDLSCEGPGGWQVQVKSRQARVGDFPRGRAVRHVLDAWARHREDVLRGLPERLVIVFELPVDGEASQAWGLALGSNSEWRQLVAEVCRQARLRGLDESQLASLLRGTSVVVLSQREIEEAAKSFAGARLDGFTRAAHVVVRGLRAAIGQQSDANAGATWEERRGLSRTDINRVVQEAVELIDRNSLEEAIRSGACMPVDFATPLTSTAFYEGESTQPGHVAAGLVVARPHVTDAVLASLDDRRVVLVVGPSGIGKSAVLWMAAYVARYVQWFRIERLREDDVEPLLRLARAYGAGQYGPVGFIVDGVGTGGLTAWDTLCGAARSQAGVLLMGSVREEDLLPLTSIREGDLVRPRLDEELAHRIHVELARRRATEQPHWREAFEHSDGLTLEFTHLLTRGQRLSEVVQAQVEDRVRQRRDLELSVLAPVALAHRTGSSLDIDLLTAEVGTTQAPLKAALVRLVKEHLVTVDGTLVTGLHPLRSQAISDAIHQAPPPSLAATARIVMRCAKEGHLQAFLAAILVDHPELAGDVLHELCRLPPDPSRLAEALQGLRFADFTTAARGWYAIVVDYDVPSPARSITFELALLGEELGGLEHALDERVVAAIRAIREDTRAVASPLRDSLIERLGVEKLNQALDKCDSTAKVVALLSALAGSGINLAPKREAPVGTAIRSSSVEELAELIQAATGVTKPLGDHMLALAGGTPAVLDGLLGTDPWLLEVEVGQRGDERVLSGSRLHASDRLNPDPQRAIKRVAEVGLGCLRRVTRAAMTTVWPGDIPMRLGDVDVASTGLLARYAISAAQIEWNRARSMAALKLVAADSQSTRLSHGVNLLDRVAVFLDDFARTWVRNQGKGRHLSEMNRRRSELLAEIERLAPPLPAQDDTLGRDSIHSLAQGVVESVVTRLADGTNKASLAAFVGDNLTKQAEHAEREPWHLIGLSEAPDAISKIGRILSYLHAVLAELAWGEGALPAIVMAARSGPANGALERAARRARREADKRHERRLASLVRLSVEHKVHIDVLTAPDPNLAATTWPPVRTCLIMNLESLAELDSARSVLRDLLPKALPRSLEVTLVPARDGRMLPRFGATAFVAGGLYASPQDVGSWEGIAPELWKTPLTDAVLVAHQALQELSGIAYLASRRPTTAAVESARDVAAEDLGSSLAEIERLPADAVTIAVTDALSDVMDRVDAETNGNVTDMSLAEAVIRGVALNEETAESRSLGALLLVATEWDINPEGAARMLLQEAP